MAWLDRIKEAVTALPLGNKLEPYLTRENVLMAAGTILAVGFGVRMLTRKPAQMVPKMPADEVAERLAKKNILIVGGYVCACTRATTLFCA